MSENNSAKSDGLFGGVEAGGTKFVCAIGTSPTNLLQKAAFPTTTAAETLSRVCGFFQDQERTFGPINAIGIGSFGPVDIDPKSKTYGRILSTPKPGWRNADILGEIERALKTRAAIDTDVNCALIAEANWGAGCGCKNLVYITIGTGVGGGVMIDGKVVYGASHPEIGHMFIPKLAEDADFSGACAFHADRCVEGLASGPAFLARWGVSPPDLPVDHPGWEWIAHYISVMCLNLLLSVSPQRIILGGGVMKQAHLYASIRSALHKNLNSYCAGGTDLGAPDLFITPPKMGGDAGVAGAIAIARQINRKRP